VATVKLSVEDRVAYIQLNRPEALNSLDIPMLDELEEILGTVAAEKTIRAVVLSGNGRAFCTGADLKTVIRLFDTWSEYVSFLYKLSDTFRTIEELPIPTIAQVHGFALAGGLELMLCCDLAVASEDAMIGDQHANFGLIAGAGCIPRLIRSIGKQAALEILYTGKWMSGAEAAEKGIVLRAVAENELSATVSTITDSLAEKSRESLKYIKRAALAGLDVPLESALNEERAALLEYFTTSNDPREGIAAFLEKRAPNFSD
jgi:enoyl-CoA hydratase/carnithine racemase